MIYSNNTMPITPGVAIDCLVAREAQTVREPLPPVCKKKEDKMSQVVNEVSMDVQAARSDVQIAKDYLAHCLLELEYDKERELSRQFGFTDDDPPVDFEEFFQRLKDGKFHLEQKHRTGTRYWRDYIRWRDPELKEDSKGLKAAKEAYKEAHKATKHAIAIKDPDTGLEALQKLEAWTYKKK